MGEQHPKRMVMVVVTMTVMMMMMMMMLMVVMMTVMEEEHDVDVVVVGGGGGGFDGDGSEDGDEVGDNDDDGAGEDDNDHEDDGDDDDDDGADVEAHGDSTGPDGGNDKTMVDLDRVFLALYGLGLRGYLGDRPDSYPPQPPISPLQKSKSTIPEPSWGLSGSRGFWFRISVL